MMMPGGAQGRVPASPIWFNRACPRFLDLARIFSSAAFPLPAASRVRANARGTWPKRYRGNMIGINEEKKCSWPNSNRRHTYWEFTALIS